MSQQLGATQQAAIGSGEFVVETDNLSKHFHEVRALDGLSIKIKRGETFGLLGPNGSGKTTLIRMIAGLVIPTSGTLRVLGQPIPEMTAKVLPAIGYMTQLQALYTDLSVWENVQFFARIFGMNDKAVRDKRIEEVLSLVEMMPRKASPVGDLSGGMKQRVSLACALVHNPRLLLLDEPTVGVDPQLRQSFWGYFRTLNSQGVTIIISSHVMDEADRCDRLGLIRYGNLLAVGTPAQIREQGSSTNLEEAFLRLSAATKAEA